MRLITLSAVFVCITLQMLTAQSDNSIIFEALDKRSNHFEQAKTSAIFSPVTLSNEKESKILTEVEEAQFFEVDDNVVTDIIQNAPEVLLLDLPVQDAGNVRLKLFKHKIYSEKPVIKVASQEGTVLNASTSVHYWGIIEGKEKSLASISVSTTGIMGMISFDQQTWELGQLPNDTETYILFNLADLKADLPFECGVTDEHKIKSRREMAESVVSNPDNCVKVYVEADHNVFLDKGTVMATANYVEGLFNEVFILYANEAIETSISEIFVWDVPSPYGSGTVLGEFRDYRNSNGGFNGDIAHLVSYNGGGGVAYLDVLCSPSFAYAYSGIGSSYQNVPNYSWSVFVVAHEMGHNVGSPHTHDCSWNGNNTPIDCCGPDAGYNGGGCGSGFTCDIPLPNAGTVMSYCHLLGGVGIDLAEGFHPQVGALFQNEVYNAACLIVCPSEPVMADFDFPLSEICVGTSLQFSDQSLGDVIAWDWTFPGGSPPTSINQNPTVIYNEPGTYDVTLMVTDIIGETSELTITNAITVVEDAVADFSYTTLPGRVVEFENLSSFADSYLWDFGDGNTSTIEHPTHAYNFDGVYTVNLDVTNVCGTVSVEQDITVAIPPVLEFDADPIQGCPTLEVTFDASPTYNATSYEWYFEGGTPSVSQQMVQNVSYDNSGTYDVIFIASNPFYSDTLFYEDYIQVDPLPTASFTHTINGYTVDFEDQSEYSDSVLYDFGDGNISTEESPSHTYNEDSTYTVVMISYNDCGTDTVEATITISNLPTAMLVLADSVICENDSIHFDGSAANNVDQYFWTFEGGTPDTSQSMSPVITYNTAGIFDVSLIVVNTNGSDTLLLEDAIEVKALPSGNFEYTSNGRTFNFEATASDYDQIEWDFGDGNSGDSLIVTHVYDQDSSYEVQLRLINSCDTLEIVKEIVVSNLPMASYNSNIFDGCEPLEVQFESNSSSNTESVKWIFQGGTPDTSILENPIVSYPAAGEYDVTLIAFSDSGSDTLWEEKAIQVYPKPIADFDFELDSNTLSLTNLSMFADSLIWDFGDGQTSNAEQAVHTYGLSGDYAVQLIVFNECGVDTVQEEISIILNNSANPNWDPVGIYPNPGSDHFWIHGISPGTKVTILNSLGKIMLQQMPEGRKERIEAYQWPEGMYFIQLEQRTSTQTFKWLLQK